ncbi:MAG: ATP-binding protein, partial [Paludibacter sp.]
DIVAFDVDYTKVDISYLILELNSDRVTKFVNSRFAGVTIPSIQIKDLLEIPILLPNHEEQQKNIVEEAYKKFQEGKIVELGFKIDELKDSRRDAYEKNMRLRKHALTQVLNKFTPEFALLKACKEKNEGTLSDDMIVASRTGENVAECFQKLEVFVNKLEVLVDRLVDEQIYGETEYIWIEQFLEDYSNNHHAISFPVRFKHKPHIAENDIIIGGEVMANLGEIIYSYAINFSKNDLIQVLDNIIVNAEKYGFIDTSRRDYDVEISLEEIDNKIVIKVANNGSPLHKSTSAEKLFTWGGGDGTGLGLWQVKNIVEHFNGEVSIIDNKEDEYPVVFRIVLPLTNRFDFL